jgi:hypothetical protein
MFNYILQTLMICAPSSERVVHSLANTTHSKSPVKMCVLKDKRIPCHQNAQLNRSLPASSSNVKAKLRRMPVRVPNNRKNCPQNAQQNRNPAASSCNENQEKDSSKVTFLE